MSIYGAARSISGAVLAMSLATTAHAGASLPILDTKDCVHWVKPGENFTLIANIYNLKLQELLNLNQMDVNSHLFAGQAISLPSTIAACDMTALPRPMDLSPLQSRPMGLYPQPISMDLIPPQQNIIDYNYVTILPDPVTNKEKKGKKGKKQHQNTVRNDNDFICGADAIINSDYDNNILDSTDTSKSVNPAQSAFGDQPYSYFGDNEPLSDALKNFSANYYIPMVMAEDVSGEVNGKIGPLAPIAFLDHMSNIYGFIWYFDGYTLFVYNANASQQKIINLDYMNPKVLKNTLKRVGVWDSRFFWKSQPKDGLIFISGPPRYIELISQTAELLDNKQGIQQKSKLTICTFNLKYAWATDKSYNFRGNQVTVPGVATILQNIINGGGVASIGQQETTIPTVKPIPRVSRSAKDAISTNISKNQKNSTQPQGPLNTGAVAETIYINADPRQNAIIVHDLESKMSMYAKIVKTLDKPTAQIEISVSIIDVSTAKLEALGVEYNNIRANDKSDFIFNPGKSGQIFPSFSTIISANIGSFNAKINLLANDGEAKVISRPSIITLDNLEAVLDNSSTSYVKVEANQDAQLFPVTSGTVIRVTPRLIQETDSRKIHMSINIEDGKNANEKSQSVPIITNSSLNTQAIVHENESLLIGGFYKEENETASTKIPFLGDLPIIGPLFKSKKKSKNRKVRMFLITPRIIELNRS
ncbi:MAG: type III secretion system outer membrane ring subunit SctC [Candidatus Endonucleobacter bathymodioli]|uniref:Type III secretion system outer membrane ring subunit SctC n=1 Tax=Candidatus Endonucleibacter bathymodioli TaxID=539814 RepID=A0AA90NXV9_9GAMM|nr:type III secretion system outer membrane ring subunit SctC [Candidatus Endonucleobacter bathymodioli]